MATTLDTKAYVYGLKCPETGQIRYIGQTVNLNQRYNNHVNCSEKRDSPNSRRVQWLTGLIEKGLRPEMVVLEECTFQQVTDAEKRWYEKLLADGVDLVNGNKPTKTSRMVLLEQGTWYERWRREKAAMKAEVQP